MGISTDRDWRQQLIFFSMLFMLAALFTSRFLLSVGLIIFLLPTCLHKNILQQLKNFVNNKMLIGIAFLFFIPFVTWFWSDDQQEWARWARIKLPLLLLPIAFAGRWNLSTRQWRIIGFWFLFLVLMGCCWSLYHYLPNTREIHANYLKAKVMNTPLGNDHVRFSLIVCIAVLCGSMLIRVIQNKIIRLLLFLLIIFFVVYLHILSARTGLLGLYLLLFFALIFFATSYKNKKWIPVVGLLFLLMPLVAWFLLPTFQNRIRYIQYDFTFIKNESYLQGSNDGNRMQSLKAGWDILVYNPWGVGSGDVIHETNIWYHHHVPQMKETDKLYPSSEWLLYGDAAGWPGFLLFTIIMTLPFFVKIEKHFFFWFSMNLVMVCSLAFDIGLEAQFGVFIYGFFILWWWKWIGEEVREGNW